MDPKRIVIVFNPVGGSAKSGKVNELKLRLSKFAQVMLLPTTAEPGSATKLTREALHEFETLSPEELLFIANGGDGTACQVAEALVSTAYPMAVYPGGTGNLFARSFNPVPNIDQFVDMIRSGRPQPIDMIRLEYTGLNGKDHNRLSMVGLGFGNISDAISDASPKFKRIFGKLVYVVNVTRACLTTNSGRFELITNGKQQVTENALAIFVLNVAPPSMATLSRGCNASDGLLDVAIFSGKNTGHIARTALRLASGRPESSPFFSKMRTQAITIRSSNPIRPNIDGDPSEATREMRMSVVPGAVNVVVSY
jgi:diacylglycerol kinase (ATP)